MKKLSSGILLYRVRQGQVEFFLVHPGGPFWSRKNLGAWSIPKGEAEPGEDPRATAYREFAEETGLQLTAEGIELPSIRQAGGKIVMAWLVHQDVDPAAIQSNLFSMEWPPRSGRMQEFPEIDRASWFSLADAMAHILPAQQALLTAATKLLPL